MSQVLLVRCCHSGTEKKWRWRGERAWLVSNPQNICLKLTLFKRKLR